VSEHLRLLQEKRLFRAYHMGATGGIERVEIVEAEDDDNAVEVARALQNEWGIEIWDQDRYIGRVEPQDEAEIQSSAANHP
jgi:hypothetical protein